MGSFPVSRQAFEKLCGEHSEKINEFPFGSEQTIMVTGLTEGRKKELRAALEGAIPVPIQAQPLMQIVIEEAQAYFNGDKGIDEVRALVQNRVQLYLDERN